MSPETRDSDERLPTTGPDIERYDRYRLVTTGTDEAIIYDTQCEDAWIQSAFLVSLDDWR